MSIVISDYPNVRDRAAILDCTVPTRFAILPVNYLSATSRCELRQLSEEATFRTLFRINSLPLDDLLPSPERADYILNNSADWVAPTVFIASSLFTDNANVVSIAINVLSNYVTDILKGLPKTKQNVKLEFVVEKKGNWSCKKLIYEGDIEGIAGLAPEIRRIADE